MVLNYMKMMGLDACEGENIDRDMRTMKFEILVDKIRGCVGWCWNFMQPRELYGTPNMSVRLGSTYHSFQEYLTAIYDYDSLNSYGKIIMKQSKEPKLDAYKDIQEKVERIKRLLLQNIGDPSNRFRVVFWAMMILTVDDTDKEGHLSLVCDLARMLEVSDEDVMDILHVIQVIYHQNEEGIKFHSEYMKDIFSKLMAAWDVPILDSHQTEDTAE